jgi:hypothetical protein
MKRFAAGFLLALLSAMTPTAFATDAKLPPLAPLKSTPALLEEKDAD